MKKFDYYVLQEEGSYPDPEDVIKGLSHLGANGWELVSVLMDDDGTKTFYFKREKQKSIQVAEDKDPDLIKRL